MEFPELRLINMRKELVSDRKKIELRNVKAAGTHYEKAEKVDQDKYIIVKFVESIVLVFILKGGTYTLSHLVEDYGDGRIFTWFKLQLNSDSHQTTGSKEDGIEKAATMWGTNHNIDGIFSNNILALAVKECMVSKADIDKGDRWNKGSPVLEAQRKSMVFVICNGQLSTSLPKYASTTAQRNLKDLCMLYIELGNCYNEGTIGELEEVVVTMFKQRFVYGSLLRLPDAHYEDGLYNDLDQSSIDLQSQEMHARYDNQTQEMDMTEALVQAIYVANPLVEFCAYGVFHFQRPPKLSCCNEDGKSAGIGSVPTKTSQQRFS
ncbi:unnamed protein product [Arabidopsis thaliana]|uniref:Uncharacterized protein n=1 Tax=Arabidopsis thaliana TaxID=3702 RepID=A0A654ERG5_ARATH|nr:unnamed protein product [Arabidopsis thaliana]